MSMKSPVAETNPGLESGPGIDKPPTDQDPRDTAVTFAPALPQQQQINRYWKHTISGGPSPWPTVDSNPISEYFSEGCLACACPH